MTEYAVEYRRRDGSVYVGQPCSLDTARGLVGRRGMEPRPVRVVTRQVGAWRALSGNVSDQDGVARVDGRAER